MNAEKLLTVEDAAKVLLVKPDTLRGWLRTGKLKGVRAGRLWRVRESEIESFLKEGIGNMGKAEKAREARLRRQAARQGYRIHKSRVRNPHVNDQGGYQVVENFNNTVAFGVNYDATLDEIEVFLKEGEK